MGKKVLKIISNFFTGLLIVLFLLIAGLVFSSKMSGGEPSFFGYQLKTVLSGSMEPEFLTGSIIAVKTGGDLTRFQEGDVITFINEDRLLITHRIIDVVQSGNNTLYQTKGDNNDGPDRELVLSDNVVAVYTGLTIPYAGYFATFAQSKEGALALIVLPGVLLLGYSIITIWRTLSKLEEQLKNKQDVDSEPQ